MLPEKVKAKADNSAGQYVFKLSEIISKSIIILVLNY
jgi:hypothetical protein